MADLLNLKNDKRSMSVFYPSQPVLGMAARHISCNDTNSSSHLFKFLTLKSTLLDINRDELAESIAFMTIMLAIDESDNAAHKMARLKDYFKNLVKIICECPKLRNLWRKKLFIFERDTVYDDEDDSPICTI